MEIIFLFQIIFDTSRCVSEQNSVKHNLDLNLQLKNLKIILIPGIVRFQITNNWKFSVVSAKCLSRDV